MKTYQGLKNLCSIWLLLSVIGSAIAIVGGVVAVNTTHGNSLLYTIGGVVWFLVAFTLDRLIDVLIDIALSLQRLSAQADNERSKSIQRLPPQLEKQ